MQNPPPPSPRLRVQKMGVKLYKIKLAYIHTVEPRFNELGITNNIFRPGKSYSKMYGIEPRFNEPISAAQT